MSVTITTPTGKVLSFGDLETHFSNGNVAGVTDFLNRRTKVRPDDIVKFRSIISDALISLPHEEGLRVADKMVRTQPIGSSARRAWEYVWFDVALTQLTEAFKLPC